MPLWLSLLPADMSVYAIPSTVAAATVTAATFFLICKSHLITLHQEQPKRNPRGKIMFVSRLGYSTAEALAERLCNLLESKGLVLEVVDARNYDPEDLPKENLIILVDSTSNFWYQPPEPPQLLALDDSKGAKNFASWLVHNAESFGIGAVVVKGCNFTAFVVGKRDGKNLMAKAANHFRDLDHVQYYDHLEEWWGSVVAMVSGDTVANGMCGESEPEDDVGCSDPKSIYMLVENVDVVDRKRTFRRRMLTITEGNFIKHGSVDLEDGGPVTAQWPVGDDLIMDSNLPTFQGFCSLGGSLFIAGGIMCNNGSKFEFELELEHFFPAKMWCLKYDGSTWTWSLCGSMIDYRMNPIVVPYHRNLYIFGGDTKDWVEIYNSQSDLWEKREVPREAPHVHFWSSSKSYFLWEDRTKPRKKTLIMLYVYYGNNYLLIVDSAAMWYIYDFSKKKLVADVHVNGLEKLTGRVSYVFCCHYTSEESLIYVFMEPDEKVVEEYGGDPDLVPYARVKLQTSGNFSTKVESKGNLKVGPYSKFYMFAVGDQDIELKGGL
ncbi:S-adenosyl-L-methionine-dependent tRNA 4-demethylwyosine synthase [Arachis hypogaea]|nr:S-adenosyl-L-methionine-dependent tRNA 4-demethylwyosine synthase [Arachis hypogaea]